MVNLCFLFSLLIVQDPYEKNLTNHSSDDRYASYSPDGDKILFESNRNGNWDLYVMEVDGSMPRQITRDTAEDRRPTWHPHGDEILFESNRSGQVLLYSVNLYNDKVRAVKLAPTEGEPIFASYSPDGRYIAYTLKLSDSASKVIAINTSGHIVSTLAAHGYRSFYPRWSPDGKRLVFFSRHETENKDDEIYSINLDGTGIERLTFWPRHNFCPSWSPDGSHIVYAQSMKDSRPEIYMMKVDGSDTMRLTNNKEGETLPNWSPDGSKLLVTAYRDDNYEIVELAVPQR